MQDDVAAQMLEQFQLIHETLKTIAKRLDRIEKAVKNTGDEDLVLLPRPEAPQPPPGTPPDIKSQRVT